MGVGIDNISQQANSSQYGNIASGLGAIGGIGQIGLGIWQGFQARKLEKDNKRPTYEIPSAIKDNMTMAQMRALEGIPEEQKQQYIDNLQKNQLLQLTAAGDRGNSLNAIAGIAAQGNEGIRNLATADANQRIQNQQTAYKMNAAYGDAQNTEFELNKLNPFYENAAAIRGLKNSQQQNVFGGIKSITDTAQDAAKLAAGMPPI